MHQAHRDYGRTIGGPLPPRAAYRTSDVARLLGVGMTKAARLLDSGAVPGSYRLPPPARPDRRVTPAGLRAYLAAHPECGVDPAVVG